MKAFALNADSLRNYAELVAKLRVSILELADLYYTPARAVEVADSSARTRKGMVYSPRIAKKYHILQNGRY